jgi:hypothetical protein
MAYDLDTLASCKRRGVLLRVASDTPIRVWSGLVRNLPIPAGGLELDGGVYQAMGQLTGLPQLGNVLNGKAQRVVFKLSGAAVTAEIAAMAHGNAAAIRGKQVDVGIVLFDDAWQPMTPIFWRWSGTADRLSVIRGGSVDKPTRELQLSCGSALTSRKRPNLSFFTPIDQARRSPDDTFFSEVPKLQAGTTKVWGIG